MRLQAFLAAVGWTAADAPGARPPGAAAAWARRLAIGLALLASGCGRGPTPPSAEAHSVLRRGLLSTGAIELEVAAKELEPLARAAAARLSSPQDERFNAAGVPPGWTSIDVRPAGADGAAANAARGLLAAVSDPAAAEVRAALGVELLKDDAGFAFRGTDYRDPADGLRGVLPDPARPGRPLGFLLVNRPERFRDSDELLVLGWRPFVETLVSAEIERRFELRGRAPHVPVLEFDRSALFQRARTKFVAFESEGLSMLFPKDPELLPAVEALGRRLRAARREVAEFLAAADPGLELPSEVPVELPRVVLHGRAADAYLDGATPILARTDAATARLIALLGPAFAEEAALQVAVTGMLTSALGAPASPWLARGLALLLADDAGRLEQHMGELLAATLTLSAHEIANEQGAKRSPFVRGPAEALLARLLLEREGAGELAAIWRGEREFEPDVALEEALHALHSELLAARSPGGDDAGPTPAERLAAEPLRGFGLWLGGLDDPLRRAERIELLEGDVWSRLAELGANAVLISYPVTPGARSESRLIDGRTAGPSSSPGDQELGLLLEGARAAGLRVALWPRLVSGESTSLEGRAKRTTAAEEQRFFERFDEHLIHAALLGRRHAVEWLVLGGSLGIGARTVSPLLGGGESGEEPAGEDPAGEDPADGDESDEQGELMELRRACWQSTLARVAAAAGPLGLVMAPSSWIEERGAGFTSELDAYGLSPFPAWSGPHELERAPDKRGVAGAFGLSLRRAQASAEALGLPLMLLEVGHARTAGASNRTARRAGPTDPGSQVEYLRGIANALASRSAPSPAALFLWRADAPSSTPDPRGFGIDLDREPQLLKRLMQSGR